MPGLEEPGEAMQLQMQLLLQFQLSQEEDTVSQSHGTGGAGRIVLNSGRCG